MYLFSFQHKQAAKFYVFPLLNSCGNSMPWLVSPIQIWTATHKLLRGIIQIPLKTPACSHSNFLPINLDAGLIKELHNVVLLEALWQSLLVL